MYYLKTCSLPAVFTILLLSGCTESNPETAGGLPEPAVILEREQQRVEYLTGGQLDQLEEMLSPTLTYTHSNGSLDEKEAYLNSLRTGQVVYRNLDHDDLEVRLIAPDVAILNGISDVSVTVDGQDSEVALRFTIVYVHDGSEWLFEAWHSSARQN